MPGIINQSGLLSARSSHANPVRFYSLRLRYGCKLKQELLKSKDFAKIVFHVCKTGFINLSLLPL